MSCNNSGEIIVDVTQDIPEIENVETPSEEELQVSASLLASLNGEKKSDISGVSAFFGSSFDYNFNDWSAILYKNIYSLAEDAANNEAASRWLASTSANTLSSVERSIGITQINSNIKTLQYQYESLSEGFTNFSSFSDFNQISSGATSILTSMDSIITRLDMATSQIESMIDYISNNANFVVGNITDFFNSSISSLNDTIAGITDFEVGNALSCLPEIIAEKLLSIDYVQDMMLVPQRLTNITTNVVSILLNIKCPSSLSQVSLVIKQLKLVVNLFQQAYQVVEDTVSKLESLQESLQRGNYLGLIIQVAGGLRFIERPSDYASVYPYNLAHVTEAGHMFEVDNTPNHERLHIMHKTGTSVEVQTDGAIVARGKNDMQIIIDSNGEIHIKGNTNIITEGTTNIYSKGSATVESDSMVHVTAPDVMATADSSVSVMASNVMIASSENITLSSINETSISSTAPLYITSNTSINMDAPTINIGFGTTNQVNTQATGQINNFSGGSRYDISGGAHTITAPSVLIN